MRRLTVALALLPLALPGAASADAVTTRIETRPYYGAVVTIEQGVRVWRALPPHDRIIIAPEGVGKVNINIDSNKHAAAPPMVNNTTINHAGNVVQGGGYGLAPGYRPYHGHAHGNRHHGQAYGQRHVVRTAPSASPFLVGGHKGGHGRH
jgi:hypothetical protein